MAGLDLPKESEQQKTLQLQEMQQFIRIKNESWEPVKGDPYFRLSNRPKSASRIRTVVYWSVCLLVSGNISGTKILKFFLIFSFRGGIFSSLP